MTSLLLNSIYHDLTAYPIEFPTESSKQVFDECLNKFVKFVSNWGFEIDKGLHASISYTSFTDKLDEKKIRKSPLDQYCDWLKTRFISNETKKDVYVGISLGIFSRSLTCTCNYFGIAINANDLEWKNEDALDFFLTIDKKHKKELMQTPRLITKPINSQESLIINSIYKTLTNSQENFNRQDFAFCFDKFNAFCDKIAVKPNPTNAISMDLSVFSQGPYITEVEHPLYSLYVFYDDLEKFALNTAAEHFKSVIDVFMGMFYILTPIVEPDTPKIWTKEETRTFFNNVEHMWIHN